MSNKTQLQTNNASLDSYIARINAAKDVAAGLPEAGTAVEAWTGTIWSGHMGMEYTIHYTDSSLNYCTANIIGDWAAHGTTITIAAGTLIYVPQVSGYGGGVNFVRPIEDDYSLFLPTANNFDIGVA